MKIWWKRKSNLKGIYLVVSTFLVTYIYMRGSCSVYSNHELMSNKLSSLNAGDRRPLVWVDFGGENQSRKEHTEHNDKAEVPNNSVPNQKQQILKQGIHKKKVIKSKRDNLVQGDHDSNTSLVSQASDSPVTKIAFLKVHKAGSTTIQNILFRFGIKNHLNFVLPERFHYIEPDEPLIPLKPGSHYDIFACHTRYTPTRFDLLTEGYATLAIIREPLKRMISAAYFYRDKIKKKAYLLRIKRENLIHDLINHYDIYDKDLFSRTRNSMGDDFGFSKRSKLGDRITDRHLEHLKSKFDLVMVMERFDESLVLMKRKYNWALQDIIYMKTNSYSHPDVNLTETEIETFKQISFLDYKIYDTFKKIFDKQVKRLGEEFQEEVEHFREINADVNAFCKGSHVNEGLQIHESIWHDSFEVKHADCVLMMKDDLEFVEMMKTRHRKMNNLPEPNANSTKNL